MEFDDSSASDDVGQPLQLVSLRETNGDSKYLELLEENLAKVLQGVDHLPISVISICGPSRQGKSFLLGYIIRYLESLEIGDTSDWLGSKCPQSPLKGFKFRNNINPETKGIWVWSKPFIIQDEDGQEIAVLLMDTQGSNDEYTTTKDTSAIIGLGLLASSLTVFNIFTNLQEDILVALNTYVQYGTLALRNLDEEETPFQNLTVLIRDWNNPGQFNYGGKGGKSFLQEKLKIKQGQPQEAVQARKAIHKCFKELDCFLLPHIGETALSPSFTGALSELSPAFLKNLQAFIENLISPGKILKKDVLSSPVLGSELIGLLKSYVDIFNSDQVPSAASLWQVTYQLSNKMAVEKALKKYVESFKVKRKAVVYLQYEDLEKAHLTARTQARNLFKRARKFGSVELIEEFQKQMENEIKKEFQKIKEGNEELRENYLNDAVKEGCEDFRLEIEDKVASKNRGRYEDIRKTGERVKAIVLEGFREKFQNENEEDLEEIVEGMREQLDNILREYLDDGSVESEEKSIVEEQSNYSGSTVSIPSTEAYDDFHWQAYDMAVEKLQKRNGGRGIKPEEIKAEMKKLLREKQEEAEWEDVKVEGEVMLKMADDFEGITCEDPPAIGIDLGTTYCCVGAFINGKVVIIPNVEQGSDLTTPSYVGFGANGDEVVGKEAKELAYRNPENTIFDAKRIIGRKINDKELQEDMKLWPFTVKEDDGIPKISVNGKLLYPEQVSAKLLAHFKEMTEKYLKLPPGAIKKAVITVPAYFDDGQRQATVDAGKLAGLEVLTILNEPTAAAIAYFQERLEKASKKVLVYDLGGGTFDACLLELKQKDIQVLAVKGDTHLGGEDFDKNMMMYCADEFKRRHGLDLFKGKDSTEKPVRDKARRRIKRLQTYCEQAKKYLTAAKTITISADNLMNDVDLDVEMTRNKFEELNNSYFQKTIELVKEILNDKGLKKEDIDDIVLVGGSSKIPKVQELLESFFDGKTLNKSIHPDHAISYGAAIQAALMNGQERTGKLDMGEIEDVTPMSLGIELASKRLGVIVPKNSTIPTRWVKEFRTVVDGQSTMGITIYQGEITQFAAANKKLGEFKMSGIPPARLGQEVVDVAMEIDKMGILHVTATCRSTSGSERLTVKEDKQRMSKEEIEKLLMERGYRM